VSSKPLAPSSVQARQIEFPWAIYVGPHKKLTAGGCSHTWDCSACGAKGLILKDNSSFQRHRVSGRHAKAFEDTQHAAKMQRAQHKSKIKCIARDMDSAGQLLVITAFMCANGISLVLLPQVRSTRHACAATFLCMLLVS
jgi:hypothetical protein